MKEQSKIKHLEDALQKYRLIFQHAPLGIYHVGIDGYITDCNRQLAEIMGTEPTAIIGTNVLALEDQAYMDAVKDAMAGNLTVYEGTYESILGGKSICLRGLFAPVEKNSQGTHEVVAILEDVTEAKEAEEKLRKSEERWQIALENSGDGVWDWHIPSGETHVTENWLEILGYQADEIDFNIQSFHTYVHPEDQRDVENQMVAFSQDKVERLNMLFRMRCKNGAYKWFSTIGKMVEWTGKKEPLRAIGTHRDVTEQQHMVEALSESERSKSVLLSNLPGMAYRCEYKDHQWEMTYISEGCYDLTGYHPEKLRLNNCSLKALILPENIIHPDYREALWEKWLQMMREEHVFRSEYPIITANQQLRWVWEQGRILTDDLGRVKALECFVTDITERKVAEEKAIATEIAFLQAQIKPHFLYNALNTIAAYCETESEKAGELILSLSTYLRGSLSFDNLQDTIPLEQELDLIKAYADIEKARFPNLRIEYNIETDDYLTLPPLTIQPLVENAIRHGVCKKKTGGTVRVNVLADPEGTLILVEDDGVGVEVDQLKNNINQGMCGKHVGLCNIQKRLKRMYGRGLEAESEPGKGTKMKFVIPGKPRV